LKDKVLQGVEKAADKTCEGAQYVKKKAESMEGQKSLLDKIKERFGLGK
jgi:hypothetical protein